MTIFSGTEFVSQLLAERQREADRRTLARIATCCRQSASGLRRLFVALGIAR